MGLSEDLMAAEGPVSDVVDDHDDGPVEVPLPESDDDEGDEDEPSPDDLSFCELCGATENEEEELFRCEECGRLHCSECGELDDEGAPYCAECCDDVIER